MKGFKLDLSPGGDGAGNQSSIELTAPMADNDTYEAADTMTKLFVPKDDDVPGGKQAIAFGRSSEPSLKEPRQEYRYRSVSMGFGLEGVNSNTGFASRVDVARGGVELALGHDHVRGADGHAEEAEGHDERHADGDSDVERQRDAHEVPLGLRRREAERRRHEEADDRPQLQEGRRLRRARRGDGRPRAHGNPDADDPRRQSH